MTDTNTTPTNTPEQHTVLIDSIGKYLVGRIEGIVERKVNEIFQSHATMRLIDENTKDLLEAMVEEKVREHESDYDHPTNDDVSDQIATHVAHIDFSDNIRRSVEEILSDGDYCTEERAQDIIKDALDDADWTEYVKEGLRGMCE